MQREAQRQVRDIARQFAQREPTPTARLVIGRRRAAESGFPGVT
jgi:hypothetical protein